MTVKRMLGRWLAEWLSRACRGGSNAWGLHIVYAIAFLHNADRPVVLYTPEIPKNEIPWADISLYSVQPVLRLMYYVNLHST